MRTAAAILLALAVSFPAWAGELDDARKAHAAGDNWAATRLLEPLAAKGDSAALLLLGAILEKGGGGVAANPVRAFGLVRRAAEAGSHTAQKKLAEMYLEGKAVGRSAFQAYVWLSAAANTAPEAERAGLLQRRADVAPELTEGELGQAQDLADTKTGRRTARTETPPPVPEPVAPSAKPIRLAPVESPSPEPAAKPTARLAGTGFIVTADGTILTNAHVVPQCRTIRITLPAGTSVEATVVASDTKNDMALLKTGQADLVPARFRAGKAIRPGDGVVVVGYPLSAYLSREANVTVGVVSAMNGRGGDKRYLQITAPVQKGNSGGPASDMSGNVIGIVATKLDAMKMAERTGDLPQNVNFAIKAETALPFMEANGVTAITAPPGPDMSAADVGEKVKRVTVFVTCEK